MPAVLSWCPGPVEQVALRPPLSLCLCLLTDGAKNQNVYSDVAFVSTFVLAESETSPSLPQHPVSDSSLPLATLCFTCAGGV